MREGKRQRELMQSQRKLDATTREAVETVVIDWMDKYHTESSNLAIEDFDDPRKIKLWVQGVWGRIRDQLSQSGWGYDDTAVLVAAGKTFFDQISSHPNYDKIKPYLPKAVTMHDSSQAK